MTTAEFFFGNSKESDPLFSVHKIHVLGAGEGAVNGIYFTAVFNNVGRYTKAGHWENQPSDFSIHFSDGEGRWYISSLAPGKEPYTLW